MCFLSGGLAPSPLLCPIFDFKPTDESSYHPLNPNLQPPTKPLKRSNYWKVQRGTEETLKRQAEGKFLKMVPFYKLIPQMGSFWNNFRHGTVFYVGCMHFACKMQARMATSWAEDTWKPNPPVLLATSRGSLSRQHCWRLHGCAEIAALTGNFRG